MLNASIVIYNHTLSEIKPLVQSLRNSPVISDIFLIDNSPSIQIDFNNPGITYIFNNKNIGYGAAHNLALMKTIEQGIPYHLVINPDISFESNVLSVMVDYMDKNANIGHLMPKVFYPDGGIQYLCKLIPTPYDLFIRRFLPVSWSKKRTDKFELRASGYDKIMDVPYLSGCFMFLRTEALKEVGLFDERFFMYPEDIDLTRRIHRKYRTVFYPKVSIIHHHAQSSYVNYRMLIIHIFNLIKYFNKWGWFFDKERRKVNEETLRQL